jgi:hypothetical protein
LLVANGHGSLRLPGQRRLSRFTAGRVEVWVTEVPGEQRLDLLGGKGVLRHQARLASPCNP